MPSLAMQLMLYGLAGVFSALLILYIAVKAMVKLFPWKSTDKMDPD